MTLSSLDHSFTRQTYLLVFAALLTLLILSFGAAFIDLGSLNLVVSLGIAITKAFLILFFFMHLRFAKPLVWLAAGVGVIWLGILIVLSLNDFLTRGWLFIYGRGSARVRPVVTPLRTRCQIVLSALPRRARQQNPSSILGPSGRLQ